MEKQSRTSARRPASTCCTNLCAGSPPKAPQPQRPVAMAGTYWGYIGRMEKNMETTEKKMETTETIQGLYRDYRVYTGVIIGIMQNRMETTIMGNGGIIGYIL